MLRQYRGNYCESRRRSNRARRLVDVPGVGPSAGRLAVGSIHNERLGRVDHIAHDALGDPAQGGIGQRLRAFEDRRARQREIDALGRRAPRLQLVGLGGDVARVAVRRLRPDNRLAIAAGDQEQALADSRSSVVAGAQLAVLDVVALTAQGVAEGVELSALVLWTGPSLAIAIDKQRTPGAELFDVLQHDHARASNSSPAQCNPGEAANLLLDGLAALGLAEMLAVRRQPDETDRTALRHLARVNLPDRFAVVLGFRVVGRVHGNGFRVVIDGDVDAPAERQFNAG